MDNFAVAELINQVAGEKASDTRKEVLEDLSNLSTDLAGPNPGPVEKLLAEDAALNWLALRLYQVIHTYEAGRGITLARSEHAQRRITHAHRRFLSAVKTLATVRRLAVPAVQINLARQQVNQLNGEGSSCSTPLTASPIKLPKTR
jgi:hypothetical protein